MKIKQWNLADAVPHVEAVAQDFGVSSVLAAALWHRGIRTKEEANAFLHPESMPFHDPFLMKDMDKAVARIEKAIAEQEKITVYGDYDVDGMSATSLLLKNLRALGAKADFYIPDRKTEGYGPNVPALQKLRDTGTKLIVTVDCGIAALKEFAAVPDIDVIVTDHHLPGATLPKVLANVNPHRADCPYPDKDLAGVGVAFKLCQALWQKFKGQDYADDLDIVSLGTVADIVPLKGENRKIVKLGLQKMQEKPSLGVKELLLVAGVRNQPLNTGHVGFRLAPRLNAAGRIGSAWDGVHLLLPQDESEAKELAVKLNDWNSGRQSLEQDILKQAEAKLAAVDVEALPTIVVAGEGWNPGVIGIVASRLVDKYYKPTIVIGIDENGVAKGSCRSIEGLNMHTALTECQDLLVQYGGHAQAAGLTLKAEDLDAFRQKFTEVVTKTLQPEDYIPKVDVEFELAPTKVTFDLVADLSRLEPYGMGNPKPLFGCRNLRGTGAMAIGKEGQHLRFQVGTRANHFNALFWNHAEYAGIVNAEAIDMVYSPAVNEWQGQKSLQCMVDSLAPAARERVFPERQTLLSIYRFLYQTQQQEGGTIPYTASELAINFSAQGQHISLYTMKLGLRIFQELGLLRLDLLEKHYYLPQVEGKMDLMNSPTFRQGIKRRE